MARTTKAQAAKASIPAITWTENMVWALLAQLRQKDNYSVLFGKKEAGENTSGERRISVYKRIAEKIIPEVYQLDAGVAADRIKKKIESLRDRYKKEAARLQQTGGGLREGGDDDGNNDEVLEFYISGDGPDGSTSVKAKNLWDDIVSKFQFFPPLHAIYATRPNVTPIAITTALGPSGGNRTIWYQPPDSATADSQIDPTLLSQSESQQTQEATVPTSQTIPTTPPTSQLPPPSRSFGSDISGSTTNAGSSAGSSSTSSEKHTPKPSSLSRDALKAAAERIEKIPKKKSVMENMHELQMENLAALREESKAKLAISMRAQLLAEYREGLISKQEFRQQTAELTGKRPRPTHESDNDEHDSPPPTKRTRTRHVSPDWDLSSLGAGDLSASTP